MNPIIDGVYMLDARTQCMMHTMHLLAPHVGEYKWSCRSNDYNGWALCDGRSLDRGLFSQLYSVMGCSFGFSDSNTFNLPDFQGRVMAGASLERAIGLTVGAETVTLDVSQMPSHTHTGTTGSAGTHAHTITDPGHTHTQTTINDDFNSSAGNPPGFIGDSAGSMTWSNITSAVTGLSVDSNGAHSHVFTTGSTGGTLAHNNMQPTLFAGHVFIYTGYHGCACAMNVDESMLNAPG